MNIKITSTRVDVSPVVKEYVSKKMSSLDKFIKAKNNVLCEIELAKTTGHHKSGDIYRAEANIKYDGKQFYIEAEKDDLYAAIDELKDEVERVIISNKKKQEKLFKKGAEKIKKALKKAK